MNIPQGYQLTIFYKVGDNPNLRTFRVHGLSTQDVNFYLRFAENFRTEKYGSKGIKDFPRAEVDSLREALKFNPPSSEKVYIESKELLSCMDEDNTGHGEFLEETFGEFPWGENPVYPEFIYFEVHRIVTDGFDETLYFT